MFDTVLVANRGEIAVRIIRTLRALGIRSVAVFSDADAGAQHVLAADAAIRLGPAAASESYLSIERIISAAARGGAQAVHPGYGFLAENPGLATACERAGLVFVGPPAEAIRTMGDKITAKDTVLAAGVATVPGFGGRGLGDAELIAGATEVGFPVLLKPSAGGGGKGMHRVDGPDELAERIAAARREALAAFGDDTLLMERFVQRPRHIEIQVLADRHGEVVYLGERECSLQRRHQKIIEEAPSPLLDAETRSRMGAAAVRVAKAVGYTGAGTVEFIVSDDAPGEFFFMEMNTRLQVEHPVTELICAIGQTRGIDLVAWQLRVAAGERLPFGQQDIVLDGHAVEARVYAEDPARGFLPTGGRVLALHEPVPPDGPSEPADVRVDSGLRVSGTVGSTYDPMLAKIIAWAPDRASALRRLDGALADTSILGVRTNLGFLRALLADPDVVAGRLDTGLVEHRLAALVDTAVPDEVLVAGALQRLLDLEPTGDVVDPWDVPGGWRIGERAWASWRIEVVGRPAVEVRVRGRAAGAEVRIDGGTPIPASAQRHGDLLTLTLAGRTLHFRCAMDGETAWLGRAGGSWVLRETGRLAAARQSEAGSDGSVTSPMPGTVLLVKVAAGEQVRTGQTLLVVEAMKMEHVINAPFDGVVTELPARVGKQVQLDEVLAVVSEQSAR